MKYWKIFFSCICLLLLVSCSLNTQAEIEKKQVEANEENDKIVATTLAITEIMDALNLDLVGIPTTQYYIPARYKNVTEVGNPMCPDMESFNHCSQQMFSLSLP